MTFTLAGYTTQTVLVQVAPGAVAPANAALAKAP